jgi:flavin-dependent dehydrogenase
MKVYYHSPMESFDVIVVGGGIAGSIVAKYAAQGGLRTLFVEKEKTPRNKPCSGIQFPYFERLIGDTIPPDRLCTIQLNRVKLVLPSGKSYGSSFTLLNFMRKPFDQWLNQLAQRSGATFIDECQFRDFEQQSDRIVVQLQQHNTSIQRYRTQYLVDASGLRPVIRRQLRPNDFHRTSMGATVNYYIDGTGDFDPHTLYQFWNLDWNDAMFAWVYQKTLDDGKNYWVVGTGCNTGNIVDRQTQFYNHLTREYDLHGEVIKKEGYSHQIDLSSQHRVWLGDGHILMVGDAAGLIDPVRGVGMDSAALSGRLAAQALLTGAAKGERVLEEYTRLMTKLVTQTRRNQRRGISRFSSNEALQRHLTRNLLKTGIHMLFESFWNRFRPVQNLVMLPP